MDEINLLNDPEMKEIFESFIVETNEILEKLDLDLVQLEKTPKDNELLNSVFRAFHTIKGTSGFLGLEKLQTVTHHCEDILNKLRKGEAELNGDLCGSEILNSSLKWGFTGRHRRPFFCFRKHGPARSRAPFARWRH